MRYTDIDRKIDKLAAKQHGVFGRQQAFVLGASERFVARRLAERHWFRPVPGVYILASSAGTWKRQCKIAELSVEGSAICGRAAAALLELPGFRPGPVELLVSANANCRHTFARVHRYAGATITVVDGIRTTGVGQTTFDLAADGVDPWRLERILDESLVGKRATIGEFEERLLFYEGSRRPGLPRIRPLVQERMADGWTPPESELEAQLLTVLSRVPHLPPLERQASLPWRSERIGRVDVLVPDHRLIVEADGRRWHTRVGDFDRDR